MDKVEFLIPLFVLQTTASDRSLDNGARLQAILYLKNGVDKYWRKNAPK